MLHLDRATPIRCAALLAAPILGCQHSMIMTGEDGPPAADLSQTSGDLAKGGDLGAPQGGAGLSGVVSRTAMPKAGGKGPLYIAVFEGNPVTDSKSAVVVGQTVIAEADLAAADARVSYKIEGIAPSPKERQVLAFLDDNRTARLPGPAPDAGDLLTLEGLGGIKVTLPTATTVKLDLVLNAVLPRLSGVSR